MRDTPTAPHGLAQTMIYGAIRGLLTGGGRLAAPRGVLIDDRSRERTGPHSPTLSRRELKKEKSKRGGLRLARLVRCQPAPPNAKISLVVGQMNCPPDSRRGDPMRAGMQYVVDVQY